MADHGFESDEIGYWWTPSPRGFIGGVESKRQLLEESFIRVVKQITRRQKRAFK